MNRRVMIALFCLVLAAALIARFPLSVAVGIAVPERLAAGYRLAEGTVWDGRLTGVTVGRHYLGDIDLSLRPWPLALGRISIDWRLDRPGLRGSGRATRGPGGDLRLRDVDLDGRVADLPTLVALTGRFDLESGQVHWDAQGCRSASGRVGTDALTGGLPRLDWRGPVLAGDLACAGNALRLQMSGAEAGEGLDIIATLYPDRRYDLTVTVDTESGRLLSTLPMLGFSAAGDGRLRLMQTGSLEREGAQ